MGLTSAAEVESCLTYNHVAKGLLANSHVLAFHFQKHNYANGKRSEKKRNLADQNYIVNTKQTHLKMTDKVSYHDKIASYIGSP